MRERPPGRVVKCRNEISMAGGMALAGIKACKIDIQEKVNAIKKRIATQIRHAAPARQIPANTQEAATIPAATRTKTGIRE